MRDFYLGWPILQRASGESSTSKPISSRIQGGENEAATRLGRIGFDHVVGYLQDGLLSLNSRPDLTATTERLSALFAAELCHHLSRR